MLLSSISLLSGDAVSDPVVVDNPDDTCTVVWDFDDPADYSLSGAELSGGDARLEFTNATEGDHEPEDYAEGTLMNLDLASIPGIRRSSASRARTRLTTASRARRA